MHPSSYLAPTVSQGTSLRRPPWGHTAPGCLLESSLRLLGSGAGVWWEHPSRRVRALTHRAHCKQGRGEGVPLCTRAHTVFLRLLN